MNLLNKNLTKNVIYEDDEDKYLKPSRNQNRELNDHLRSSRDQNDMRVEDLGGSPLGFVPFMRTDEFLDPAHAGSPIPPSRESSAIKQERDKARKAYYKNQNPGNFGMNHQSNFYESLPQHNQLNNNRMKVNLLIKKNFKIIITLIDLISSRTHS